MVNMISKVADFYKKNQVQIKRAGVGLAVSMLAASPAFAAIGTGALCTIKDYYKAVLGIAALIGIFIYVMNSFFSKSAVIAEIVQSIIIGCAIAAAGVAIVTETGLAVGC